MPLLEADIRHKVEGYIREMKSLGTNEVRRETCFNHLLRDLFGEELPAAKDIIRAMRPSTGRVVKGTVRRGTPDSTPAPGRWSWTCVTSASAFSSRSSEPMGFCGTAGKLTCRSVPFRPKVKATH